jgi:hypothetical protein
MFEAGSGGTPPRGPIDDLRDAYRRVFESDDGRTVLGHLIMDCDFHKTSHREGDSHTTAFHEGHKQSVRNVLFMLSDLSDPKFAHDAITSFTRRYGPMAG